MNKVLYIILISLFSLILISCADKEEEKKDGPVLTEVYPVTTPTSDPSPNYTFSSTKAGTITYGGSCSSGTTSATSGRNTITFVTLSAGTYSDCTIIVTDSDGNASNTLAITSFTVTDTPDCCSSGSAIIKGLVEDNASEALSGVSVIFAKSGTTSSTVTTVDNGTYSKSTLSSGTYTLTYTKSGFIDTSLSATLTADNETLEVDTVQLFADTCASTGTISGTIKDAVSNSGVANVSLSARSGMDTTSGTIVQTTTSDVSGNYSLSSMSTGWYTVEASKSGYMATTFNVFACGDQIEQDGSISTTLSSGSLRIVLSWKSNKDLDGHLTGPDKGSGRFHVYYGKKRFHYDINTYSSSRSSSDNVTQDVDSSRKGPETITISAVRSGTYRYYVHNYTNKGQKNHMGLYKSKASVKVYHSSLSGGVKKFKAPNKPGDLWTVFEFNLSSGLTRIRTVGSESSSRNVDNHGSSLGISSDGGVISAASRHTCAILDNASLKCWGKNSSGQLGYGNTNDRGDGSNEMGDNLTVVDLGTGRTATAISTGDQHTCAILDNASVKCWGLNTRGQLGYGHNNNLGDGSDEMGDNLSSVDLGTGRTATEISAGLDHTCAILDNASVKCWGYNSTGQLGYGHNNNLGDGSDEMGDNLSSVDLGTGRTATEISAGRDHTCAILDNDSVKCWGKGYPGQLGYGNTNDRGDGSNEMGDNLPVVDLGTGRTATTITTGYGQTCAILDNASVKCWGYNSEGQLGYGHTNHLGGGPEEMGDNLPVVDLGTGHTATAIGTGYQHTCVILDNASVKCWGNGGNGQIGSGNTDVIGDGSGEMGDNLTVVDLGTGRTAIDIFVGNWHSCALLDNSSVKCWGYNSNGQLGYGHTNQVGDGSGEMGDNLSAVGL